MIIGRAMSVAPIRGIRLQVGERVISNQRLWRIGACSLLCDA